MYMWLELTILGLNNLSGASSLDNTDSPSLHSHDRLYLFIEV